MTRKTKNADLGRALANRQNRKNAGSRTALNTSGAQAAAALGRHTDRSAGTSNNLVSILEATDLDELMLNAQMNRQTFESERYSQPLSSQSVIVIPGSSSADKHKQKTTQVQREQLTIPRRPAWTRGMTYTELMRSEDDSFVKWRQRLATVENELELGNTFGTVTPFEKNLDVWRQLWRVIERSAVILQIVDARHPSLYLSYDLARLVAKEAGKMHVLVMNKADLLSTPMLDQWQTHFKKQDMRVVFFSAFKAAVGEQNHDPRILNPTQFINMLHTLHKEVGTLTTRDDVANDNDNDTNCVDAPTVIGLCGYPNVGKSSTINVLLETVSQQEEQEEQEEEQEQQDGDDTGNDSDTSNSTTTTASTTTNITTTTTIAGGKTIAKRVGVSSTPGKTKHFQTLPLTDSLTLCDCPGLVFPNFAASKAELICAGVLSIDTMRGDYLSPVQLVSSRIPSSILAAVYGLTFPSQITDTYVSADQLLDTHARARGYMTDHGRPDQSRSARTLLKDLVSGRIVYAHAPEGEGEGEQKGEAGVGAEVFAKKGKLVHKRVEQAEMKQKVANEMEPERKRQQALLAGTSEHKEAPRAMMAGRSKRGGKGKDAVKTPAPFVRVERAFAI